MAAASCRSSWSGRSAPRSSRSCQIRTIENPLVLAAHDAERVRAWLSSDESDRVLKVYAAVVGNDPKVERSSSVAMIDPTQVAAWLASLPPQKSLDASRRDKLVKQIRAAL